MHKQIMYCLKSKVFENTSLYTAPIRFFTSI